MDIDRDGQVLKHLDKGELFDGQFGLNSSVEECCALCLATQNCTAWVYTTAPGNPSVPCYLKGVQLTMDVPVTSDPCIRAAG